MTKDEVLRLALEALETSMYPQQKQLQAITAIKSALEAKDEPVMCGACNGSGHMVRDHDIGTDQKCFVCEGSGVFEDTTPPQRKEPEPVVWMYQDKSTHEVRFQKHMRGFVDHGATYETPLYTTPPPCPTCEALARTVMMGQKGKDV